MIIIFDICGMSNAKRGVSWFWSRGTKRQHLLAVRRNIYPYPYCLPFRVCNSSLVNVSCSTNRPRTGLPQSVELPVALSPKVVRGTG